MGYRLRIFLLFLVFVFFLLAGWTWADGKTIYIDSANGLDSNDGTTSLKAVKSMIGLKPLINAAKAGDTIIISGVPIWGITTGEGDTAIITIIPGIIWHKHLPDGTRETIIEMGGKRFEATTRYGSKQESIISVNAVTSDTLELPK